MTPAPLPAAQAPFVLLPGFMADETLWREIEPALAARAPVIHGSLREGDSIAAMARHVIASLPERCVLVGFSMGGYVAREIVRQAPERVAALVLVATSGRADSPLQAQRKTAAVKTAQAGIFRGLSPSSIRASVHVARENDAGLIDAIRQMGVRLGGDVFFRQSHLVRDSDLPTLAAFRCPTLVVAADQDRLRSLDEARELQAAIPGARLEVIADSGHMIPLEQPAALLQALTRWLDSLPR